MVGVILSCYEVNLLPTAPAVFAVCVLCVCVCLCVSAWFVFFHWPFCPEHALVVCLPDYMAVANTCPRHVSPMIYFIFLKLIHQWVSNCQARVGPHFGVGQQPFFVAAVVVRVCCAQLIQSVPRVSGRHFMYMDSFACLFPRAHTDEMYAFLVIVYWKQVLIHEPTETKISRGVLGSNTTPRTCASQVIFMCL